MKTKFLILSVVIAIVFTISLTENLQKADGLSAIAIPIIFEMEVGQTAVETWQVLNNNDNKGWVEFYASGEGSEFLIFEELIEFKPRQSKEIEIIVSIPKDHSDNIEYKPLFFALQRGSSVSEGVTGAQVDIQLKKTISIKIGDNPIYTAPDIKEKVIIPDPIVIPEKEEQKETLEEKIARMKSTNADLLKETLEKTTTKVNTPSVQPVTPVKEPTPVTLEEPDKKDGGGCLIATATYGSELAPQVQFLRELRDNTLLSTDAGVSFMGAFNSVYYTFSPVISDLERENPVFREAVKLTLTPMLSTLSIMTLADEGSESQVLGLGISVIALNLAMYFAAPVAIIHRLRK